MRSSSLTHASLSVKIVKMSIAELLKYEEEGEEKLSDEEMCQRWAQVMCEAREAAQSLHSCDLKDVFILNRMIFLTAIRKPLLWQMAYENKYNLSIAEIRKILGKVKVIPGIHPRWMYDEHI